MMVDELSQIKFYFFHEKKNLIVEPSFSAMSKWKENRNKVDFFRCDNTGKNKSLDKRAN